MSYYYANGSRIAMRVGNNRYFLLGDHLGSTTITADSAGAMLGELRYKAWGEQRYAWGTMKRSGFRIPDGLHDGSQPDPGASATQYLG